MKSKSSIYAISLCDHFDVIPLHEYIISRYQADTDREVIIVHWNDGEAYVFDYGVVILWDIPDNDLASLFSELQVFFIDPVDDKLDDEFTYEMNCQNLQLKHDHLCLPGDRQALRLAISHAIAQSTKIAQYENSILKTITNTAHIPENIARTGSSGLRRKELAKLRGYLYLTKSDVMLHYDLLEVPEFFWENPELQPFYTTLADYLEINPRIDVLNKKLATIQDLLQMIADEQKHAHSSLLEWIIIWLIAIDIIILLLQEFVF